MTQNLPSSTPGLLKTAPSSNPALNPAHGQPGHRCDIPVGAPLNSAPVKAKANSPSPGTPAVATTSAPGLNPPHGQPGHRCDIAAGAPLNAPARENYDTSKTTPQVIIPPNTDSSQVSTFTGSSGPIVQLNPPHGQPGHACTIPVGKLLKQ